jgi:hypothetical protein
VRLAVFGRDSDSALHFAIKAKATKAALVLIERISAAAATFTTQNCAQHQQQPQPQQQHHSLLEFTNAMGVTPIILAAQKGNITVVRKLLLHGVDPLSASTNGTTAMLQADHFGHVTVMEDLLRAASCSRFPLQLQSLIEEQANSNLTTPLMRASQKGHMETVQLLLQAGANVNRHGSHAGVATGTLLQLLRTSTGSHPGINIMWL